MQEHESFMALSISGMLFHSLPGIESGWSPDEFGAPGGDRTVHRDNISGLDERLFFQPDVEYFSGQASIFLLARTCQRIRQWQELGTGYKVSTEGQVLKLSLSCSMQSRTTSLVHWVCILMCQAGEPQPTRVGANALTSARG